MEGLKFLRLLSLLSTGIAAGAMTGHALLLGRFLAWFFRSGRTEVFLDTYPVFLRERKPERFFDNLFIIPLVVTAVFNAALFFSGRTYPLAFASLGLQGLFVAVFLGTGFGALERKLFLDAVMTPEDVRRFLALNGPVTALSALLLVASLGCLACIPL